MPTIDSHQLLQAIYITDSRKGDDDQLALVERLLQGGMTAVQLRDHQAPARDLYQLGLKLRQLTHRFNAGFIVNDRLDVALSIGADGVHLSRYSLPVNIARKLLGPNRLIGYSAHSYSEIMEIETLGVSYCSISPIFHPNSKHSSYPPLGIERLKQIALRAKVPLVALGGIEPITASACRKAGAAGVAAIGALSEAQDPFRAAIQFSDSPERAEAPA